MTEVHRYQATVAWSGSTALGYEDYPRSHVGTSPPAAAELALSSDQAFRGDPSRLNPEQLLVQAAVSCQLLSFLAVAARARLDVVAYDDRADAEMPDGPPPVRITRIVLRPHIVVDDATSARAFGDDQLGHLVEVAHRECYIANSLTTEIVLEPTFEHRDPGPASP